MFAPIARFLNMYSGEIGVAICASSSTLVLGYMMDDYYKVQLKKLKNDMESLKTEYDKKIRTVEKQIKLQ